MFQVCNVHFHLHKTRKFTSAVHINLQIIPPKQKRTVTQNVNCHPIPTHQEETTEKSLGFV